MKTTVLVRNISLCVLVFIFLFSCNNEEEINLGNDFYYIPFQESTFDVTAFGGNGIYKIENHKKVPVIFSDVEKYNYNSNFIIVKQNFNFEETCKLIDNMIFHPDVYFTYDKNYIPLKEDYLLSLDESINSSAYSEKFIRELMENSSVIQKMKKNKENYYIIEKRNFKMHGPLTKSEFKRIKQNLGINLSFE